MDITVVPLFCQQWVISVQLKVTTTTAARRDDVNILESLRSMTRWH